MSRCLRTEQLEKREMLNGTAAVFMPPRTPPSLPAALVSAPLHVTGPVATPQFAYIAPPVVSGVGGVLNNATGVCDGKVNETWRQPYANPAPIIANWVPQRGDQLVWKVPSLGCQHTAVITNVSKTVIGSQTVYNLTIYQSNADNHNSISTFQTSFAVARLANGQLAVSLLPKFSANSPTASGYDR